MDLAIAAAQETDLLIRGIFALSTAIVILVGSIWLLLAMVLGWRMGYLVMGSTLFGLLVILSIIWYVTGLGPKGPETTWFPVGVGPELTEVAHREGVYDVSDYPGAEWQPPEEGAVLADLPGGEEGDAAAEAATARPVLQTAVNQALDPESREEVDPILKGEVELESGAFHIVDVRLREAEVEGKESLLIMGRAVPSTRVRAGPLGEGIEEGTVQEYLVSPGDPVDEGDPVLVASTAEGEVTLTSDAAGRVISLALREPDPERDFAGDVIKENVPFLVLDTSAEPGAPLPVEVAAVRVRGSVRTPAFYYLVASSILFALHLGLLNRAERARRLAPQPA